MGLYFHAAWLKNNPEFLEAFLFWIDEVLKDHKDVYFVTMTQVIQWMQNPRTVSEVSSFEPWKDRCTAPKLRPVCAVSSTSKRRQVSSVSFYSGPRYFFVFLCSFATSK